ncbi:MAG: PAS domain-containing sensor histidine kinase [Myxococcales bacterium]|nr:PAS domain-containing sensor histidine kinase [Myxococcales bacterium]
MEHSRQPATLLLDQAPICILVVDRTGVIQAANVEAQALFGWTEGELVGSPIEVLVPGPLRRHHAESRARFAESPRKRTMGSSSRLEARHRDGHLFPVDVMLAPIDDGRVLAVVVDRSELRRVEDEARRGQATFRHVMENVQDIVYVVRTDDNPFAGRVELLSDHVSSVVGYAAADFITDPELWFRCIHPDDIPELSRATTAMFETGRPVVRRYRMRHKDSQEWRQMEDRAAPLPESLGRGGGYCGVARDVSAEHASSSRMMQTERLAALGLLASGVSHELGNPLTYVLASMDQAVSLLDSNPTELSRTKELLGDALEGARRMQAILADFAGMNRASSGVSLIDVRRAADLAARLASASLGDRTELVRRYTEVPPVRADETRLAQVVLNVLLNAAHAIPEGRDGHIVLTVERGGAAEVVLTVADDGDGMAPGVLGRVFEPFFTTKPPGIGTGLGLHVCRTLVREMGGDIKIESTGGQGACVRVVLPAAIV